MSERHPSIRHPFVTYLFKESFSINHILINYPKYVEARKIFINSFSLHQVLNEENVEVIPTYSIPQINFILKLKKKLFEVLQVTFIYK